MVASCTRILLDSPEVADHERPFRDFVIFLFAATDRSATYEADCEMSEEDYDEEC